jgi:transposase
MGGTHKQKVKKGKVIFEEQRRFVAGIDLAGHADHYVCGPRRDDGEPNVQHFGGTTNELKRMANWLTEQKVVSAAMESTSVYWIPVCEILESHGIEVVLVDTREVHMVPGRKSDVQDCQWLQRLHSCGLLSGSFRPSQNICAIRTLIREKAAMVADRAVWVQRMQKSLDQMNIRIHHAVSDLDGVTGLAILHAIIEGERDPHKLAALRDCRCKKSEAEIAEHLTGNWREEHLFNLRQALMAYEFVAERICDYEKQILLLFNEEKRDDFGQTPPHPDEKKAKLMKRLGEEPLRDALFQMSGADLTIFNGIRPETSAVIISEIGLDFSRFPSEKHFVSYIGLAPRLGKSAGKNVRQKRRKGRTSRVGAALRMAASSQRNSNSEFGAYFRNVARRQDAKTAIKATARRMAVFIYRLVRYGKEFIDRGAELYEAQSRTKKIKSIGRMITSMNLNYLELEKVLKYA